MRGSSAPTEQATKMRPASIAGRAMRSNSAAGAASTTMSQSARSARPTSGGGAWKPPSMASALAWSRTATAASDRPGTPASRARASGRPMAPSPAIATVLVMACPLVFRWVFRWASRRPASKRAAVKSSCVLTLWNGSHATAGKSTRRIARPAVKSLTPRGPGSLRKRRSAARAVTGHSATRWCTCPTLLAQAGGGASAAARSGGMKGVSPGTVSRVSAPCVAAQSSPASTPASGP